MPCCVSVGHKRAAVSKRRILNINVGIMGHVDSGKTSLARALSTTISTAALVSIHLFLYQFLRMCGSLFQSHLMRMSPQDKNPQSQERGITLDLGFSSFTVPLPEHLKDAPYDDLQFTVRPLMKT
jgi:selenocysteine-specific elongation factor